MRIRYIIISVLALVLGLLTIFLPQKDNSKKELDPIALHNAIINNTRFVTCDELANMIISDDPSFQLVDIRNKNDYDEGHINGAINIQVEDLFSAKMKKVLKADYKKIILYGYGTVKADQCWIVLKRNLYDNVYVLEGGLNNWHHSILHPDAADSLNPSTRERYTFRLAASKYFTKESSENKELIDNLNSDKPVENVKNIETAPVKVELSNPEDSEEGC